MKSLTRKLFISVMTLAIAIVSLTTTTYAWFTKNTEINASGISMSGQASSGDKSLYIMSSESGATWGPSITFPSQAAVLKPVTRTAADDHFAAFKKVVATTASDATAGADYYQYTFYLKTDTTSSVYLLGGSGKTSITYGAGTAFTPLYSAGADVTAGTSVTRTLQNVIRFGISTVMSTAIADTPDDASWSETVTDKTLYHTISGDFGQATTTGGTAGTYFTKAMGAAALASLQAAAPYVGDTETGSITFGDTLASNTCFAASLTAGFIAKVTLTIWVEGWDADCFDAIATATQSIAASFYFQAA